MLRVTVTELKNRLSHYLRLVKSGETIEVLERRVPVAVFHGVSQRLVGVDSLLERLERDGIVSRPTKKPGKELLKEPPVPCKLDPVKVLIEERGSR
jgi:prevent-host-death family protein